jgi:hypothetical protein
MLISYKDWKLLHNESSPFTRTRDAAAKGLGPSIPCASVHSRSTGSPFQVAQLCGEEKKKRKKKKN